MQEVDRDILTLISECCGNRLAGRTNDNNQIYHQT